MTEWLLIPPVAFLIYLVLAGLLSLFGRKLAGSSQQGGLKSSIYASGEQNPTTDSVPGYRSFFIIALFFAILHMGVLMIGSGGLTIIAGIYLGGLLLALVALILG